MHSDPIKRANKDSSREKSLYFLLQATARQLTETREDRDVVRELLPHLIVTSADEFWSIGFAGYDEKTTLVPKSNFDFYRHTDNPNLGQENRAEAAKVLITLIPELNAKTHLETMDHRSKIASRYFSLKNVIPTFLVVFAIFSAGDSHIFRSSLIAATPIIFYEIKSVYMQICLSIVGLTIGYFLPGISTDYVYATIASMVLLDALRSKDLLKNKTGNLFWFMGKLGILIGVIASVDWDYLACGILIAGAFFNILRLISGFRIPKKTEFLLLILASLFLPIFLLIETPWHTSLVRLMILTPTYFTLVFRNRSIGLNRYLIVNSVVFLL